MFQKNLREVLNFVVLVILQCLKIDYYGKATVILLPSQSTIILTCVRGICCLPSRSRSRMTQLKAHGFAWRGSTGSTRTRPCLPGLSDAWKCVDIFPKSEYFCNEILVAFYGKGQVNTIP